MVHTIPAKPALPRPSGVQTQAVQWHILKQGSPATSDLFTLTEAEFNKLTSNETELLRWIKEAAKQLDYYSETPDGDASTVPH